jgi:tRNA(Arg) A34 adenosine deaminase TadA
MEAPAAWTALDAAAARALELAHETLLAGGLAVGCAVRDGAQIVAEGRNRAYDPATGQDPLERTPLAHAEMNALARIDTDASMDSLVLWTTQQPCSMCQAAIEFVGIPAVRVIAPDPSDPDRRAVEALDGEWVVLATAMFLAGPLRRGGSDHPIVVANATLEPEALRLAVAAVNGQPHPLTDGRPLNAAIAVLWTELGAGAERRRRRILPRPAP